MGKYVLTVGMNGKPAGTEIELTEEQAQHPLYRMRVKKLEGSGNVELVVATPSDGEEPKKRGRKPKDAE